MRYDVVDKNAPMISAMEAVRRYDTRFGSVRMRPEGQQDERFLFELFRSHAARQLTQAGLNDAAIDTMMQFQFRSQTQTYRDHYPDAVYSIIESEGRSIGRLIEEDEGECVYFVDFALLPERQAKGLGTAFIEQVADEWAAKGRAARVEVQYHNEPSLKLCRKLGFTQIEDRNMGYVNLLRRIARAA